MKAKTIDRLELTRRKFGKKTVGQSIIEGLQEAIDNVRKHGIPIESPKSEQIGEVNGMIKPDDGGLKQCPMCGSKSLRLDGGCMSCLSCGWSACG